MFHLAPFVPRSSAIVMAWLQLIPPALFSQVISKLDCLVAVEVGPA